MKKLRNYLAFSNLFVSLCVTSITAQSMAVCKTGFNIPLLLIVFCSTVFIYNYYHYKLTLPDITHDAKRYEWHLKHKKLSIFMMSFCVIAILILLWFISFNTIFMFAVLFGVVLSYSLPVFPGRHYRKLRDLPYIKVFLISVVVSTITVSVPILEFSGWHALIEIKHLMLLPERFLFIVAITLPFDIRDMQDDSKFHLRTIPVQFGISVTKWISTICLMIFTGLCIKHYISYEGLTLQLLVSLTISAIISLIIVWNTNKNKETFYYTYFVEGSMLLQSVLVIAATLL